MNPPSLAGGVRGLPALWRAPSGRGFILLAAMSACFGLAMNTSNAVTTNYFADVLHFTGPQFGYITAIREVPGFLLIFVTALLYRMSQQRLTAAALVVLGVGLAGYAVATSFTNVLPWVVLGSLGFHTVLQTQVSLGMNLSEERHSGRVLGTMAGILQAGALVGTAAVLLLFLKWPDLYHEVYVVCGFIAVLGAAAILGFPHLHEGRPMKAQLPRQPIVFRRSYRYYYLLNLLDGADDACAQGVEVVLEGGGVRVETSTDAFGQFAFDGLPKKASYRVSVAHPGYATRALEVRTDTDVDVGVVRLAR